MDIKKFKSEIIPLQQKMFVFAKKMMDNESDAEDIVQETFLRLWSMREQLDGMDNPAGFAMQIVKNSCIDKLRQIKTTVDLENFNPVFEDDTPYAETERNNSVDVIRQIIERLPELQRRIILMRDVEGYELQEIAEITGTQVTAVTMNLSRARKNVRDQFLKVNAYRQKQNHYE